MLHGLSYTFCCIVVVCDFNTRQFCQSLLSCRFASLRNVVIAWWWGLGCGLDVISTHTGSLSFQEALWSSGDASAHCANCDLCVCACASSFLFVAFFTGEDNVSHGTANWFLAIAYLNHQQSNLQQAFHSEESLSLPVMHFITYATRGALFRYSSTTRYAFLTFLFHADSQTRAPAPSALPTHPEDYLSNYRLPHGASAVCWFVCLLRNHTTVLSNSRIRSGRRLGQLRVKSRFMLTLWFWYVCVSIATTRNPRLTISRFLKMRRRLCRRVTAQNVWRVLRWRFL